MDDNRHVGGERVGILRCIDPFKLDQVYRENHACLRWDPKFGKGTAYLQSCMRSARPISKQHTDVTAILLAQEQALAPAR